MHGIALIRIDLEHWPLPVHNIMRGGVEGMLFFSTHDIAVRHAESWACKREADIRRFVGNTLGARAIEQRRAEEGRKIAAPPTSTSGDETDVGKAGVSTGCRKKRLCPT